jgi:cytoskeletal protein CcmA (bactofilin family)
MANRVPLIVNTSALQIQEMPEGDNLDLTNNSIIGANSITAGSITISGDLNISGQIIGANNVYPGLGRAVIISSILNI